MPDFKLSPNSALSALKDIHLPAAIHWWPLAKTVQVFFIVLLISIILASTYFFKKYKTLRPKREALKLLKQYEQEYIIHKNTQMTAAQISELLKRVALAYFHRKTVAGLQGDEWIAFLNQSSKVPQFELIKTELTLLPYTPPKSGHDFKLLFRITRQWISERSNPWPI